MLILLPPSEGKRAPVRGAALDLDRLSFATLGESRALLLKTLVELSRDHPQEAAAALGLGPTQQELVHHNAGLLEAPTARAERVYDGVLYDALDLVGLDPTARRRAARSVAVTSALFGLLRPGDRIPSYRLSGDTRLPGTGPVKSVWRDSLGGAVEEAVGSGLLVDLRSGTYAAFWRPAGDLAARTVTVRVLHEAGGQRKVVSHFNKATKGRLVRALLEEGARPGTPAGLAEAWRDLGWQVEQGPSRAGAAALDVVVEEL